jgi:hypothetical protein
MHFFRVESAYSVVHYSEAEKGGFMLKLRLIVASLGFAMMLPASSVLYAQTTNNTPAAPLPSQILTAKKVFISNAGGLFDLNMVSGDRRRGYNQFYAAVQSWGQYQLVASPAEADLVLQISLIYIPRQVGAEVEPFPSFRLALLDPKTNVSLWVVDEFLVDKPGFSMIREKNRDKAFDDAIDRLVGDLKALTAAPASK